MMKRESKWQTAVLMRILMKNKMKNDYFIIIVLMLIYEDKYYLILIIKNDMCGT